MTSLTIPPVSVLLAAHERQIPLAAIVHQIYDSIRTLGKSVSGHPWTCFPFCTHEHAPDQSRSWPRMGDFRDALVAGLLQAPPSDNSECARIKQLLAADLERQRQMFLEDALHLTGDFLACANTIVDDRERDLTALPGSPLTQDDMRFYARLKIQTRIRQMLDADIASGLLVVSADGEQVLLDNLVAWSVGRKIMVKQDAFPGCSALVDASYQRIHLKLSGVPAVVLAGLQPQKGMSGTKHKIKNRTQPLEAEIDFAMTKAIAPGDPATVWTTLSKLAEEGYGAMVGYSSDGIQYRGKKYQANGELDVLTFKNLRQRMDSAKRAKTG